MTKMKKVLASIMAIVALLSVCTVTSFASPLGVVEKDDTHGNMYRYITTLKRLGGNTQLCSLKKVFEGKNFSKFRVYENDSEIDKMEVWVKTEKNITMSKKHVVYPTGKAIKIQYYDDVTFTVDSNVVFMGEQSSITDKQIHYKAFSY